MYFNIVYTIGHAITLLYNTNAAYPRGLGAVALRWSRAQWVSPLGCIHMCASGWLLLVQGGRGSGPHICTENKYNENYILYITHK